MNPLHPDRVDLAFHALEFRQEFDALLKKHGGVMKLGWAGKWATLQIVFPSITKEEGLTLLKCAKNGKVRYDIEEPAI